MEVYWHAFQLCCVSGIASMWCAIMEVADFWFVLKNFQHDYGLSCDLNVNMWNTWILIDFLSRLTSIKKRQRLHVFFTMVSSGIIDHSPQTKKDQSIFFKWTSQSFGLSPCSTRTHTQHVEILVCLLEVLMHMLLFTQRYRLTAEVDLRTVWLDNLARLSCDYASSRPLKTHKYLEI